MIRIMATSNGKKSRPAISNPQKTPQASRNKSINTSGSHSVAQPKNSKQKESMNSTIEMLKSLKVVYKYATDYMTIAQTFEIPMPADILGHEHNQIILQEDIIQFGAMVPFVKIV
ncbi:uncharacterized protein LOC112093292 [Morus notabilis]|uniref:uncharacterized protein LOC112093292 n=1 Tax=Morus notabilis TaxID=981085 RepID=UPI000CED68D2|nr:uncharacterized protein LOC112093292 [Morus notabilis]